VFTARYEMGLSIRQPALRLYWGRVLVWWDDFWRHANEVDK
jgi:hypothetical protein